MKLIIGNRSFDSKTEAHGAVRDILSRNAPGARLAGKDHDFITALLSLHPRLEEVQLERVIGIEIELTSTGFKRFRGIRTDNTSRDFSWQKCITPQSHDRRLRGALRSIAREQIVGFRNKWFDYGRQGGHCEHCRCLVTDKTCHIDHVPPQTFEALVVAFLASINRQAEEIELRSSPDSNTSTQLADKALVEDWYEYHARHADLRVLCVTCNLSTTRKT